MSSSGSGGQCHVDTRVHQDPRFAGIRETKNLRGEIEEIPCRKIFFADLHPFDTGVQIPSDVVDQRRAMGETASAGDVAVDETILH